MHQADRRPECSSRRNRPLHQPCVSCDENPARSVMLCWTFKEYSTWCALITFSKWNCIRKCLFTTISCSLAIYLDTVTHGPVVGKRQFVQNICVLDVKLLDGNNWAHSQMSVSENGSCIVGRDKVKSVYNMITHDEVNNQGLGDYHTPERECFG